MNRRVDRVRAVLVVAITTASVGCGGGVVSESPDDARVVMTDLKNFVEVFSRLDPEDPECQGLDEYFERGSPGLKAFRNMVGGPRELCEVIRQRWEDYASLEARLDEVALLVPRIEALYRAFGGFYPEAVFPDVYFAVGRFWSGGTVKRGKVIIGAELMRSPRRTECLVVHELAHAQQRYPLWRLRLTGGPRFLRGTLLAHAVKEGAADFVAEVSVGCNVDELHEDRVEYARSRGCELWEEFLGDMNRKEFAPWLYGGTHDGRPADMGYYIGYLITNAYYERAAEKSQAIREIFTIRDFTRFLEESGFAGEAFGFGEPGDLCTPSDA